MLIEFEVANFLSFHKPVRLSMVAAAPIKERQEENVFDAGRQRLLKSAAIYGANASGKSNLLSAFSFMRWLALNSSKETQAEEHIRVKPFKLDVKTGTQPSRFEVVFSLENGVRYRYGFEADATRITAEWLFLAKVRAETTLFVRDENGIQLGAKFTEGRDLEEKTRANSLFLSVVAQFNGPVATRVLNWFRSARPLHAGVPNGRHVGRSIEMLQEGDQHKKLLAFLRHADLCIEDLEATEREANIPPPSFMTEEGKQELKKKVAMLKWVSLSSMHGVYDHGKRVSQTSLDFESAESDGTQKFFHLAGPILDALENGSILLVDELEAGLHPLLTRAIVRLFNSSESNPKNAQLIFTTHDTNLLSDAGLRRDQIWFVEKDRAEATDLYSLAEFKLPKGGKVRNDAAIGKNYIQGRYGAVPFLGDFATLGRGN